MELEIPIRDDDDSEPITLEKPEKKYGKFCFLLRYTQVLMTKT